MKCFICKKELKKESAYMLPYTNWKGRTYKRYYCSKEEYNNYMKEKLMKKVLIEQIDCILGYVHINKTVEKEIKNLHEEYGYSYEQMFDVALKKEESIKYCIEKNNITEEWKKIRYIFTTIKNILESSNK